LGDAGFWGRRIRHATAGIAAFSQGMPRPKRPSKGLVLIARCRDSKGGFFIEK
jgi:hypothetical protein